MPEPLKLTPTESVEVRSAAPDALGAEPALAVLGRARGYSVT
jgi:hypothetical protein